MSKERCFLGSFFGKWPKSFSLKTIDPGKSVANRKPGWSIDGLNSPRP